MEILYRRSSFLALIHQAQLAGLSITSTDLFYQTWSCVVAQDASIIRALHCKFHRENTQGVKEAGLEASIARSEAMLRAYHRIASANSAFWTSAGPYSWSGGKMTSECEVYRVSIRAEKHAWDIVNIHWGPYTTGIS